MLADGIGSQQRQVRRWQNGDSGVDPQAPLWRGEVMPHNAMTALVADILARAPDWIRKDLASKDPISRTRAEEALAALIGSALSKDDETREA